MGKSRLSSKHNEVTFGDDDAVDSVVVEHGPKRGASPIRWAEWRGTMAAAYGTALAGFEHYAKRNGKLRQMMTAKEWRALFDKWMTAPSKTPGQ